MDWNLLSLFQVWGKEILSLFILLPLVWYFIKNGSAETKRRTEIFEKWFKEMVWAIEKMNKWFFEKIEKHEENDLKYMKEMTLALNQHDTNFNKSMNRLMMNIWNTVLNKEQTVNLLLTNMWFVSYSKLNFIKNTLVINHIFEREEEVKSLIKEELIRQSDVYLKTFSEYITPIWDLAEWLNKSFWEEDFKEFLDRIYWVIFQKKYSKYSKEAEIELKMNDIRNIMKSLQNSLRSKLRKDIESL